MISNDITLESCYKSYLETLPLATLRVLGRKYSAPQASATHKGELVETLAGILAGRIIPPVRSPRGAPPKASYIDPAILARISEIGRRYDLKPDKEEKPVVFEVHDAAKPDLYENVNTGILEITQGGYGFLRAKNCQPSADGDVFFAAPLIHSMKLREGDFVVCTAKPRIKNESPAVDKILSVNEKSIGSYEQRPVFDNLTAQYPKKKFCFSANQDDLALRVLDLFIPIGKGQRGLIIAPPKAGKTTLLKAIAKSVSMQRDLNLIVLLIDERPEEVTDIRESVRGAEVIYSTFDEGAEHHVRAASLTLERAKRLVELGKDVVILLDSLTKLTRAHNFVVENTGKILSGGLDAAAFAEPKRFFGAARNTVEAGSLTILATALVDTGSRMDDIIYEEFKGTGNADIFLSRDLAEKRIFPAIDIKRSGTRKEELLLTKEELAAVYKLRERGFADNPAGILDMLRRTRDNAEFVAKLPDWMRVFKNA